MLAPRVLRELSWCTHKLLDVADCLSRLEARLTVGSESVKMTAPRHGEHDLSAMSPRLREPELPFPPFKEEYCDEDLQAEAEAG